LYLVEDGSEDRCRDKVSLSVTNARGFLVARVASKKEKDFRHFCGSRRISWRRQGKRKLRRRRGLEVSENPKLASLDILPVVSGLARCGVTLVGVFPDLFMKWCSHGIIEGPNGMPIMDGTQVKPPSGNSFAFGLPLSV